LAGMSVGFNTTPDWSKRFLMHKIALSLLNKGTAWATAKSMNF